jgi:hypothetical protein
MPCPVSPQNPLMRGMGGDRNQWHGQSAALPSRWGAGTRPGSPGVRGGSPMAALFQPLH